MASWNLWHGCTKISPGCMNCYMYRRDEEFGKDASVVEKTSSFDLPVRRKRDGSYVLQPDGSFSEILSYAHKLHLAGVDKESALKQSLSYARTIMKKKSGGK